MSNKFLIFVQHFWLFVTNNSLLAIRSSTWDTYFLRENMGRTKYVYQQDGADFCALAMNYNNYLISLNFLSFINATEPIIATAIIGKIMNNMLLPVCGITEFAVVLSSAFSVLIR